MTNKFEVRQNTVTYEFAVFEYSETFDYNAGWIRKWERVSGFFLYKEDAEQDMKRRLADVPENWRPV